MLGLGSGSGSGLGYLGDEAFEDELAVDDLRLASDGRAAVAVERREEGALAGDRRECLVVVERADIPRHLLVLVADLDADRAL
eukprot:scaffold62151_cov60-Phaeocystis_antarctica.AAC.3